MKFLIFTIMLFSQFALADEDKHVNNYNGITYIKSDKLKIFGRSETEKDDGDGSNPPGWLTYYETRISYGYENFIQFFAEFDIDNVQIISIIDMNAKNLKCGNTQERQIFFLAFTDPGENQKKISTRIKKPCLVNRNAVFKLTAKTADNKYYYNIITLTASNSPAGSGTHRNYHEIPNSSDTPKSKLNNKLMIKRIRLVDSSESWRHFGRYGYPGMDYDMTINIDVGMDALDAIIIEDINAINKKCNPNQAVHPLFLRFTAPITNQKNFTTRITEPCYINGYANLKLRIKTADDKYYYNNIKIKRPKISEY